MKILYFVIKNVQNGYELKQFSIVNCDADNMITIEKNFTAKLTSDCEMSYDGCVKIKSFKEGMVILLDLLSKNSLNEMDYKIFVIVCNNQVKYRFSRDGYVLLTNSANLCNETIMGIHLSCPAGEIMFCLDDSNVFDMSVLKKTMSFLIGTSTLHAEITHDTVRILKA